MRHPSVTTSNKIDQVEACTVVIATADKWAYVSERTRPWAIVDARLTPPPRLHRRRPRRHPELLDNHPSTGRVQLNVPVKFPDGWEANRAVLAHLSNQRVQA
ncbi:hypothetical protein Psi02_15200 [Planotetraspora silvatica]|uniref:Uncharacterized protein n=1 Tax=Planotetraspora silvatica TaxID=234614 RepID=A0A8J3XMD7_9ACTN|nr:hypothetical protein [Planotetraspora silvatica]GII45096.1 hypothetical protein Psi02_15200 [Planotetraspora silvatica]